MDIEWLGQVIECPALECGYRALKVRVRGYDNDWHVRVCFLQFFQEVESVAPWHTNIANDHLGLLVL